MLIAASSAHYVSRHWRGPASRSRLVAGFGSSLDLWFLKQNPHPQCRHVQQTCGLDVDHI